MNESAIIMTCVRGVVVVGAWGYCILVSKQVKEEGIEGFCFGFVCSFVR